jgi:NAD(P)-dependent dehydrogenase (short-subunit alcohol dehydrogenase family)
MTAQFTGKAALITGGGTGIGRASALALAAEGCSVTVCGRTARTLEETVKLVEAAGGVARAVRCDVSDEQSVREAVEAARAIAVASTSVSTAPASAVGVTSSQRPTTRPSGSI